MSDLMLTVVTGNEKKYEQMSWGFGQQGISCTQANIDLVEIQTLDAVELAKRKAMDAYSAVGGPVVIDDGGIYFDQYRQFPGIYAKFMYQALGFAGLAKLFEEGDTAVFRSHVAYYDAQLHDAGKEPLVFIGENPGTLTRDFDMTADTIMPYAEFFIPDGSDKPLVKMSAEDRKADHRQLAVQQCAEWLLKNRE